MKKLISLILVVALAATLVLSGCSATADSATDSEVSADAFVSQDQPAFVGDETETYYLETFLCGYDYWASYYEGFMDAGRQLGVNTKYVGATSDEIDEQVRVFEQIMAMDPAGIMVNPNDGTAVSSVAQECIDSGIPLVVAENPIPDVTPTMFINHDESAMTLKAADYIAEQMGGSGEMAMLVTPGQLNLENRDAAFKANMEQYPGIEIVFEAGSGHDAAQGAQDTHQIMASYPNVQYIFCDTPDSAMGAVTAVQEGGYDVRVLTFDTNANVLDYIKEGKLDAAIMPDPYVFGYMGLMALYMDNHNLWDPMWDVEEEGGSRSSFEIPLLSTSCTVVTKENADFFYSDVYKESRGSDGYDMEAKDLTNEDLPGSWTR